VLGARRSTAFGQSVALAVGVMILAFASTLLILLVILRPFRKMSARSRHSAQRFHAVDAARLGARELRDH